MNRNEFISHVESRCASRLDLLRQKGAAYSGNADAFANFKRNAEKLGLSRFQVWAVYCGKHLDAIFGAIRRDPNNPTDPSEGLQGRIDDAINYFELLSGMVAESQAGGDTQGHASVPTNEFIASELGKIFGGNGLTHEQQVQHAKSLLDLFYGPRHFSL